VLKSQKREWSTLDTIRKISPDWEIKNLLRYAVKEKNSFVNGPFGSDLLTSELTDHGVPVIYIRDISQGRYLRKSTVCVKKQKADSLPACRTLRFDVLIYKVGDPPCESAVYDRPEDAIVTQDVIKIRTGSKQISQFLVQLLNSDIGKRQIKKIKIRGTRDRVSLTDFKRIKLPYPPLKEQKKIAQILSTWDKTIETVGKLIEHSKAQKKALMQQLLTGPGGKNWKSATLKSLADSNSKNSFIDGDWVESPHIKTSGFRLIQTGNIGVGLFENANKRYISEESFKDLKCKEVCVGDLLIGRLAEPAGRSCIVPNLGEKKMITSVDVTLFRPEKQKVDAYFLIQYLNHPHMLFLIESLCGGSTRTRVSRSNLGKLKIPLPSLMEQKEIAKILENSNRYIENLEKQKTNLIIQKKSLMQQLLTGKRRVKLDQPAAETTKKTKQQPTPKTATG